MKTEKSKRGGAGRNQGRKPISPSGEQMKSRPVRMTDADWDRCKALGGASWVRIKIAESLCKDKE